ncbi:MAG: tryptophan--tRNA ligase, partial [Candidatus Moranbacteria bacterium]|nr:tryptophan--tRNA ligase [Candidatus Moranbacteria bacterium]
DKGGDTNENVAAGLFDYPVLMAADILLYDTEVVPVGEDQVQHIELTRTLARRFNKKFGETFVVPEANVKKETMRIMGLDDPTKKMSKSAASEYNYIGLLDDPELIAKKIKKAVTGSGSEVKYSDDEPALKNLINIFSAFSGKSASEIVSEYKGKGYADFKEGLTKAVLSFIIPFQEKFKAIDDKQILDILQKGAEKVQPLAKKKIEEVKAKVGFIA